MKYTPDKTAINVSVNQVLLNDEKKIKVVVSDKGKGVDESLLEDIFEPFFRANKSRDKTTSGYGLGLALAKRQIEAVNGSICAKGNKPNGLMFEIILPLA